jgi:IS30 family transposase
MTVASLLRQQWSPWQRGFNEQINGLVRQYFPKGMDLSGIHQNRLNAVARRLNERPREALDFETPAGWFQPFAASRCC